MAMKKPTKSDISAGRVFRCGNCDALCTDEYYSNTVAVVMGRDTIKSTTYFCDKACACKKGRDEMRPTYERKIEALKETEKVLKDLLQCYIHDPDLKKKKSKTLFQAIKMVRQYHKAVSMLLSGEYAMHIVRVECFKLSEAAMELAELVAEEEDPEFNGWAKEFPNMYWCTEYKAQNTAMWARSLSEDKNGSLSMWFN